LFRAVASLQSNISTLISEYKKYDAPMRIDSIELPIKLDVT
jgi:hypothetical protein